MSLGTLRSLPIALGLIGFGAAGPGRQVHAQARLVIDDVTVTETNSGTTAATLTLSVVDATPHGAALVSYTISGGTAVGAGQCSAPGADFIGVLPSRRRSAWTSLQPRLGRRLRPLP